jgi:hypothetical protein
MVLFSTMNTNPNQKPRPSLLLLALIAFGMSLLLEPQTWALPPRPGTTAFLRNLPGRVTASGPLFSSQRLLYGAEKNAGLIPAEVGEVLVGQDFLSFQEFRKAFWKAISQSAYQGEFSSDNRERMSQGCAPRAMDSQSLGDRSAYELHHILPLHHGGEVLDLKNLMITTPRFHREVLHPPFHFGSWPYR